jgi:hypothetical protein
VLLPHHAAAAGVQRVLVQRAVVFADRSARVERHAGDPLHPGRQADHPGGARERRLRASDVAHVGIDADVGGLVVEPRRIGRDRGGGGDHRRQRPVVDRNAFGGVARRGHAFGHHHGDLLPDIAHAVGGKERLRRVAVRGSVAVGQRDVGRRLHRDRHVRHVLEPVGRHVGAGQHGEHARHGARRRRVNAGDARMRVRGAHEHRIGLSGQVDVVAVAAAAGEQAPVFLAVQRLADDLRHGGEVDAPSCRRARPRGPWAVSITRAPPASPGPGARLNRHGTPA